MLNLKYLKQSFFFYRQHLGMIAKIQLPFLVAINALAQWFDIYGDKDQLQQQFTILALVNLTVLPLYWSATIVYMQSVLEEKPLSAFQATTVGLSRWRPLLLTFILTGLGVFTGLMFLIVPGIFIGVRLAFADYICVVEKQPALKSLKQSWEDTEDYFWPLLQGLAILYIGIEIINYPLVSFFQEMESRQFLVELPVLVALDLLSALITVYAFRMYCVMRDEKRPNKPVLDTYTHLGTHESQVLDSTDPDNTDTENTNNTNDEKNHQSDNSEPKP